MTRVLLVKRAFLSVLTACKKTYHQDPNLATCWSRSCHHLIHTSKLNGDCLHAAVAGLLPVLVLGLQVHSSCLCAASQTVAILGVQVWMSRTSGLISAWRIHSCRQLMLQWGVVPQMTRVCSQCIQTGAHKSCVAQQNLALRCCFQVVLLILLARFSFCRIVKPYHVNYYTVFFTDNNPGSIDVSLLVVCPFFSFCYFCVFAVSFSFSASDMLLIELAVCCILFCASLAVCDA